MSASQSLFRNGYSAELVSAHTHIILLGSIMMMIMGVALWFFPRPEKDDNKYKPGLIIFVYWLLTSATTLRFISQVIDSFSYSYVFGVMITIFSFLQVVGIILFFYSIWGRIRSVGSHIREARGEKF
jgi:heme/copper-type cytochrome/quinol oxidase subunit 1